MSLILHVNIVLLHVREYEDPRNQRETVGVYIGVILLPVLADFMYCSILCSISEAKLTFYGSFRFLFMVLLCVAMLSVLQAHSVLFSLLHSVCVFH